MNLWSLNTIGIIFISLTILLAIAGCFYLVTKENTAIFFTARVSDDEGPSEGETAQRTIVFVGDIMLDRGVEYRIKQNNNDYFYPFAKLHNFLKEFDIVFGNLEGPIVENPPSFSDDSLTFAFDKAGAGVLKKAGFNIISLANNHTDNMFLEGLIETRDFLSQNEVSWVGEPWGCNQDFLLEKQNVLFLAFNRTYPGNCPNDKIAEQVRTVRTGSPEKFLIVSLHWGEEYQPDASVQQKELAHQLVEAGADLIVGHHPHVVQDIELYKQKLIFYSLGNFVFDQYFSKATQEGLVVGLEFYSDKLVYRLFPISGGKAQPFLMEKKEKKEFLQGLSERSSEELFLYRNFNKIEIPIHTGGVGRIGYPPVVEK